MGYITYFGHASFRVITESGLVFYIDPYVGDYSAPADVVLVTHQHFDHNRVDKVNLKSGALVITNAEALVDGEYNSFQLEDVLVRAVPAYNKNHPKDECVGYVMEFDGRKIYFAGDTGLIDEMKDLAEDKLDLAFIPCDGIFTMSMEEAGMAASWTGAQFVAPIHMCPQYQKDDDKLFDLERAQSFPAENKIICKPNESFGL